MEFICHAVGFLFDDYECTITDCPDPVFQFSSAKNIEHDKLTDKLTDCERGKLALLFVEDYGHTPNISNGPQALWD